VNCTVPALPISCFVAPAQHNIKDLPATRLFAAGNLFRG
jgi:hypothetical protein